MSVSTTRRIAAVAAALGACLACAAPPARIDFQLPSAGQTTSDGLREVEGGDVSAAYMRPEAVFAAYDSVALAPLVIANKEGTRPLEEGFMLRLEQIYRESFTAHLGRSEAYTVVGERGPRTLFVTGQIVNLDVRKGRYRGGEYEMVLDSGEMTLVLDVRDGTTGESLARIADRRRIRPQGASGAANGHRAGYAGYENSPVNIWGAMREIIDNWGRTVRRGLDDLHALAPQPIPDELGDG